MKRINILLTVIVALTVNSVTFASTVDIGLNEGDTYFIDDNTYSSDYLNITGQNSIVNIVYDASVDRLTTQGITTVNISDGSVGVFTAYDNTTATITGGTIVTVATRDDSIITISGGSIERSIHTRNQSIIYLEGTNFYANDHPLSYGDTLRDHAVLTTRSWLIESDAGMVSVSWTAYAVNITGILEDGSAINIECAFSREYINGENQIGDSDIIIIPEPATIALLSIGGLLLRKRIS